MTTALVSIPWALLAGGLLFALIRQADHAARERADLCQRIQAPDVAVAQHVHATDEPVIGLGYVPVDDDEAMADEFRVLNGVPNVA